MATKKIIYPIFFKCGMHTTDVFWKTLFENLAYGIPPSRTFMRNDCLCCNAKNKQFCFKIKEDDDSVYVFDRVHQLLSTNLDIISIEERLKLKNTELNVNGETTDWSLIKKKTTKDVLIEKYVLGLRRTTSSSMDDTRKLLATITIGLVLKVVQISTICISDGCISGINIPNLNFKKEPAKPLIVFVDKKYMSELWKKRK